MSDMGMNAAIQPVSAPVGGLWRLLRLDRSATLEARSIRVSLLLAAVCLMGAGDLYMTLAFARTVGMVELNPIARALMIGQSPAAVVLYKLGTMLFAATIIYAARRSVYAEFASWLCFILLASLTIHWIGYSGGMAELTPEVSSMAMVNDPQWVRIGP